MPEPGGITQGHEPGGEDRPELILPPQEKKVEASPPAEAADESGEQREEGQRQDQHPPGTALNVPPEHQGEITGSKPAGVLADTAEEAKKKLEAAKVRDQVLASEAEKKIYRTQKGTPDAANTLEQLLSQKFDKPLFGP
jgi:hypothetical protein